MQYTIQSGVLYQEPDRQPLMRIKRSLIGPGRTIMQWDNTELLKADVCNPTQSSGDVRLKEYRLTDTGDKPLATGHPNYAEGEAPEIAGWPISRLPRVDHAGISLNDTQLLLTMHNSLHYTVTDPEGDVLVEIVHKGLGGGWSIRTDEDFTPDLLCGFFVFCRYVEQENEFLIV